MDRGHLCRLIHPHDAATIGVRSWSLRNYWPVWFASCCNNRQQTPHDTTFYRQRACRTLWGRRSTNARRAAEGREEQSLSNRDWFATSVDQVDPDTEMSGSHSHEPITRLA